MKISTKGHYAVQALVDMADRLDNAPVTLSVIAQRQNLSQNYLEQLFVKLRKSGIVNSVRGPGGGYLLARSPSLISIGEIFNAVDENIVFTECSQDSSDCAKSMTCKTQNLWSKLCQHFNKLIFSVTLANVVQGDFHFPETLKVGT